jgi:hypothetical protein
LKQLNDIDRKRDAIRSAFLSDVFNSKAHQDIMAQITDATKKMTDEAGKIKAAAKILDQISKVIDSAVQIAGLFAMLAA